MKRKGLIITLLLSTSLMLSACSNKKDEKDTVTASFSETVTVDTNESVTETNEIAPTDDETLATTVKSEESESNTDETEDSTNEPLSADFYDGTYMDSKDTNTIIEISTNDDITTVSISSAISVTQSCEWTFSGKFDENGTLSYSNCKKTTTNYTDETTFTKEKNYKKGKGSITIIDNILTWNDNEEGTCAEAAFEKLQ